MICTDVSLDATSGARLSTYFLQAPEGTRQDRTRPVVVVVPGGGYGHLSAREAEPVALRMNALGFHACVLSYSVEPARYPQALVELARAVAWLRSNAAAYGIDPQRVVVCGFSAGGHLAACLGTMWQEPWLAEAAGADCPAIKPDALTLGYAVITAGPYAHRGSFERLTGGDAELAERLSLEKRVSDAVPPTFLWHTFDDEKVPVENSLLFAAALRKAQVPFSLHVFPHGAHGSALGTVDTALEGCADHVVPEVQVWPDLMAAWLRAL